MSFCTFTKIGNTNYKVIVNRESRSNDVSSDVFGKNGLKFVPHSHMFKAPWPTL